MSDSAAEPTSGEGGSADAIYYDGKTTQKHVVALKLADRLEIFEAGVRLGVWTYADIRRADGQPGVLRLRNIAGAPLARLEIRDASQAREVERLCSLLEGEAFLENEPRRKILFWSLAATVSVVLVVWFGIPRLAAQIAPLVPISFEHRFGDAANTQIRAIFSGKVCMNPQGRQALQDLVAAMQEQADLPITPVPEVLESAVPNAFALPGGRVYVLSKLLDQAESPDELAGILAHEFGHVAHRDGLRRLITDGSTSFLIGLLFGDVTGASVVLTTGRTLLSAAYSRETEASADLYARNLMQRLGRPPQAMGTLMVRILGTKDNNPFAIFASHPLTAERIAALAEAPEGASGPPLLSDEKWHDLKAICH